MKNAAETRKRGGKRATVAGVKLPRKQYALRILRGFPGLECDDSSSLSFSNHVSKSKRYCHCATP
jgi:hypothetical protein